MMAPSETSVQTTNVQKTDTSRSMGVKVTTKTESTGIADNLELNPWYFKTVPGILKLVQLLIVSMLCTGVCLKEGIEVSTGDGRWEAALPRKQFIAIICMGCGSPVVTTYTNFFMFVVAIFFIITLILCIVYFFTIKSLFPKLPWLLIELSVTAIGSLLYFIVAVVQLAATDRRDYHYVLSEHGFYSAYIAAGCFGLFNFVAYGAGAFFLFMEWKQSKPPATPAAQPNSTTNGTATA